jgi:hypothetical protein
MIIERLSREHRNIETLLGVLERELGSCPVAWCS